jgi:hypothetical protein
VSELVTVDTDAPGVILETLPITGLDRGESILAIDFRPLTGQLYALSSEAWIGIVNPVSGFFTRVGNGRLATTLTGRHYDLEFDPTRDTLRLTSDAAENFRINPTTAELTVDSNVYYAVGEPGYGTLPCLVGASYTNSVPNAVATTLFAIDQERDALVRMGSVGGIPLDSSRGELFQVGGLGIATGPRVGFDTSPDGVAWAALSVPGPSASILTTIDLVSGRATPLFSYGALAIRDLAVAAPVTILYALGPGNLLATVRSDAPETPLRLGRIEGLVGADELVAIDVLESTGLILGLGQSGLLYEIDPETATARALDIPAVTPALDGRYFGLANDPSAEESLRIVSDARQNLGVALTDGAVTVGNDLTFAATDRAAGLPPFVTSLTAFDSQLIGIDTNLDMFVALGGEAVFGPLSPSSGILRTLGEIGLDAVGPSGLTAVGETRLFAGLNQVTSPAGLLGPILVTISPTAGTVATIGRIGDIGLVLSLVTAPVGVLGFDPVSYEVDESSGVALVRVVRTGGNTGAISVSYTTSNGSATAGSDYRSTSGVLRFAEGQVTASVRIPLISDASAEAAESFALTLFDPTGGADLGPARVATVTIRANEAPSAGPVVVKTGWTGAFRAITGLTLAADVLLDAQSPIDSTAIAVVGIPRSARVGSAVALPLRSVIVGEDQRSVRLELWETVDAARYREFRVRIDSGTIRSATGHTMDGDKDGFAGGDALLRFAVVAGRSLSWSEPDGDRLMLNLRGAGVIRGIQSLDGFGAQLWIEGTNRRSRVEARIVRHARSDRVFRLNELIGSDQPGARGIIRLRGLQIDRRTLGDTALGI